MSNDDQELRKHLERLHIAGTSPRGLMREDEDTDEDTLRREHMHRLQKPDGRCFYCRQAVNRFHPIGPIVITVSEPDDCGDSTTREFCTWECFSHWAAVQSGGKFIVES
jgi:hypothetical protein